VLLDRPEYVAERGEIVMSYRQQSARLDLSSSGRGLQQTLLLLSYMAANRGAVLLLDEPDAHLEILRQRQIYQILSDRARQSGSQIIAASHSEVLLNEAADRDVVVAFVGSPHRIDDRGSQVVKALKEIGFEHYYQAEQTGWVLYLEGATDLAILRDFAQAVGDEEAQSVLERPFVHYVANQPDAVRRHFHGLREARPDLVGIALFDRLERPLPADLGAVGMTWNRREVENYLCFPEALDAYARAMGTEAALGPLFEASEAARRARLMQECCRRFVLPAALEDRSDRWWSDVKASDEFLDRVFEDYFAALGLPNLMRKGDYHQLAQFVPRDLISEEVREKLGEIVRIAKKARAA
jgi:hypothetical protein